LISSSGDDRSTLVLNDDLEESKQTSNPFETNLRGSKLAKGLALIDPQDGISKIFFLFSDLSVRAMGEYRIELTAFDMLK
jgi:hypothetical protein